MVSRTQPPPGSPEAVGLVVAPARPARDPAMRRVGRGGDSITQAVQMQDTLDPEELRFFRHALTVLNEAHVPYMVGGAYALERLTGIIRRTKDIDIFVRPTDCAATLDALGDAGYGTELVDPMWLAKT